jgi:hypothetical protein
MSIRALAGTLFLAAALAGCGKDLPLPASNKPGKLVLIGELIAGEPFSIRAGQSAAMGSKSVPIVQALTITVRDGEGGVWTAPSLQDQLSEELRTVSIAANAIIRTGSRYTLSTQHSTLGAVESVVEIPQPITATLIDTIRGQKWGSPVLEARIQIQDAPGQHFYVIEAVRQQMAVTHEFFFEGQWRDTKTEQARYDSLRVSGVAFNERRDTTFGPRSTRITLHTDDAATENVRLNGAIQPEPYRRVMLTDKAFAGGAHTTAVSLASDAFLAPFGAEPSRVRLQVKSVTKEYFDFLSRYERAQSETASEPNALQGNVVGGYGAVGGVARVEWTWVLN